ncbi:MAG: hypothetical protein SGPRY_004515, partial [Prymnesium sp.]
MSSKRAPGFWAIEPHPLTSLCFVPLFPLLSPLPPLPPGLSLWSELIVGGPSAVCRVRLSEFAAAVRASGAVWEAPNGSTVAQVCQLSCGSLGEGPCTHISPAPPERLLSLNLTFGGAQLLGNALLSSE